MKRVNLKIKASIITLAIMLSIFSFTLTAQANVPNYVPKQEANVLSSRLESFFFGNGPNISNEIYTTIEYTEYYALSSTTTEDVTTWGESLVGWKHIKRHYHYTIR